LAGWRKRRKSKWSRKKKKSRRVRHCRCKWGYEENLRFDLQKAEESEEACGAEMQISHFLAWVCNAFISTSCAVILEL
jgi:hypothetical protein